MYRSRNFSGVCRSALVPATITVLVQPEGETLILPIFNFLHAGLASEVCFLCLLLLALTVVSMTLAAVLLRRRKE